uniref:ribosomal protein L18 n=1 Tax=Vacuolaria virescens TaxID=44451 RepID=UPI0021155280|nr:ribosomal protein L18 [Vacuolaria virescens]UTE94627.1 ribosomal protein L18 [Vacuolaria virescens]
MKSKIKKKILGTTNRPRLCVFRSNQHIYAQVIDDTKSSTLVSCSTLDIEIREQIKVGKTCKASELVGFILGKRLLEKNIKTVVFDKRNRSYHGRIKALADGVRKAGLIF